jgi:uncharacterized delta-60 repeat protein
MEKTAKGLRKREPWAAAALAILLAAGVAAGDPADLDASFGDAGRLTADMGSNEGYAQSVVVQPDGKILVAGYAFNGLDYDFALARFESNGSPDTAFGGGGSGKVMTDAGTSGGSGDYGYSVAVQGDGKILVCGQTSNASDYHFAVVRYNANGTPDTTFGAGTSKVAVDFNGTDDLARSIAVQGDGKILVAGYSRVGSTDDFAMVRLLPDGALDSAFGGGTGKVTTAFGTGHDLCRSVLVQPNGKILLGGNATIGSSFDFAAARYNEDGSLDSTFGGGTGKATIAMSTGADHGYCMALQGDGKILVGGYYNAFGTQGFNFALARFTSAGAVDTGFGGGTGKVLTDLNNGADQARCMAVQSDGKILLGGFGTVSGQRRFAMVRYDAAGVLDSTFATSTGNKSTTAFGANQSEGSAMALQQDGKILMAGQMSGPTGVTFAVTRHLGSATLAPSVTLTPVTGIASTTATLRGTVNPGGLPTSAQFEWGLTNAYGGSASVVLSPSDGATPQGVSANLTGLTPGTTYHFRLVSNSPGGTLATSNATFRTFSLVESWRLLHFGTLNNSGNAADGADPDGDGCNNAMEFLAGTVPTQQASLVRLEHSRTTGLDLVLRVSPVRSGVRYIVETSSGDFNAWTPLPAALFPNPAQNGEITDAGANSKVRRFYRLKLEPAP